MADKNFLLKKKRIKRTFDKQLKEAKRENKIIFMNMGMDGKYNGRVICETIDPNRSGWREHASQIIDIIVRIHDDRHEGWRELVKPSPLMIGTFTHHQYKVFVCLKVSAPECRTEHVWPLDMTILACLMDKEQYGEVGGKSFRSICQDYDRMYCNGSYEIGDDTLIRDIHPGVQRNVKRGLKRLLESGIVVQSSLTGAYWVKSTYRQVMRQNGISYLPTVER